MSEQSVEQSAKQSEPVSQLWTIRNDKPDPQMSKFWKRAQQHIVLSIISSSSDEETVWVDVIGTDKQEPALVEPDKKVYIRYAMSSRLFAQTADFSANDNWTQAIGGMVPVLGFVNIVAEAAEWKGLETDLYALWDWRGIVLVVAKLLPDAPFTKYAQRAMDRRMRRWLQV